jgi:16S rRNA processing protein RimM
MPEFLAYAHAKHRCTLTDNLRSSSAPWIAAARLLRPQGRRGELLAEPLTDLPGVFATGLRASLKDPNSTSATETTIESSWSPTGRNAGRIVLKLAGIDTISAAESLIGSELLIPSTDLPALEPDTWFVRDLIGCQLLDVTTPVGQITAVEYPMSPDGRTRLPDAAPLLEVTLPGSDRSNMAESVLQAVDPPETALIPFIKAWLESVDLESKRVIMHLPTGLLDLTDDGPLT